METKWVLKLIDQITAPLRAIQGHSDGAANAVESIAEQAGAAQDAIEDIVKPLKQANAAAGGLENQIDDTADAATRLNRNIETIKDNIDKYKGKIEVETDPEKLRVYKTMLDELEKKLKEIEQTPDPAETKDRWGKLMLAINQTWEVAEKVLDSLEFAGEVSNLQTQIQQMTDTTGEELDKLTRKVYRLAKVFGQDADEIAHAANAMTKQIGGSFEENIALIQAGFEKGANLNKDFIEQLNEYGPQIKAMGLTGAQAIALMAKAGKDGVFSDKAIDAIKEANLSLREMGQPQIDALHAIGLKVKDLAGKTTFEVVQMVTKAMQAAPLQAKQMALTDIFKGAGEDAGLQFIEGLASVDLDINKIPSVKQSGESTKGFLADMQSWFATTFSSLSSHISTIGSIGAALAGFVPVLAAVRETTIGVAIANKAAALGQWLLNSAFLASPVTWVVAGLAAVTAAIVYAWDNFEGFREVVFGLWESFKTVFNNIAGLFKTVFAPVAEAIAAVLDGRWADAAKAAAQLNPISMLYNAGKYIADGGLTKGVGDAYAKGKKAGSDSFKNDQKGDDDKKVPDSLYPNEYNKDDKKITLDGKLFNPKTGTMGGSGLEINGAAGGGGKSISMSLTIHNHFGHINSSLDIRKVADDVAGLINDRLRDSLVTVG